MSEVSPVHYLNHGLRLLFGMHQKPFCKEWDELLNSVMDEGEIVDSSECTITFQYAGKRYGVWIENQFYSFGHIYYLDGKSVASKYYRRPSLKTMVRLSHISQRITSEEHSRFRASLRP